MRGNQDKIVPFQWKKGQRSPNPGGRPRNAMLSQAIRERLQSTVTEDGETRTVAEMIADVLVKQALTGDIRSIREVADRAEGKSTQAISVESSAKQMTPEQRNARINELLSRALERGIGNELGEPAVDTDGSCQH